MNFLSKPSSREKGDEGEEMAVLYFRKSGFRILEKNWKTRRGEVDLILEKKEALFFVEVKFRKNLGYGTGEEAIHFTKQKKMVWAALDYLQRKKIKEREIRFAALTIDGSVLPALMQWVEFPLDLPPQYY